MSKKRDSALGDGHMMHGADDVSLSVHLKPVWFCDPMSPL